MKKMKKTFVLTSALFAYYILSAQGADSTLDINITTNESNSWYTSPVIWIAGAAVFILLLVALTRGSRRTD